MNHGRPVVALADAIAQAQAKDPFAPVTVVVPSPYARVQLRRAVGATRGICNVAFRTWGELVGDLARSAAGTEVRLPARPVLDEALRKVLLSVPSPFASLARSSAGRRQLALVFGDLWRAGTDLRDAMARGGETAESLVAVLCALESHLAERGFTDPGRLLDLAADAPVGPSIGSIVRWCPAPLRARDEKVLERLADVGIAISTIGPGNGAVGCVVACSDPDVEVRVVARRLVEAAAGGIPLWEQAVIHPPSTRYSRLVHGRLERAGLPTSGPSPRFLVETAAGRATLGLLDLASGEWRRNELMDWLSAAPITTGPGQRRAPIDRWDDISARAGVVQGLDQWDSRLLRFSEIGPVREQHMAHTESEAGAARALRGFVQQLALDLAVPSGGWSTWARWCTWVLQRYLEAAETWPRPEQIALDEVLGVVGDLGDLDLVGSDPDLPTFRDALAAELGSRALHDDADVARPSSEGGAAAPPVDRRGLPGPVGSGVFVGTPSDALGLTFRRVIVVGGSDDFLPGLARAVPFLDADIEHPDWPTKERAAEELHDELATVIALCGAPVTVTRPVLDPRTGRELAPSRWFHPEGELGGWVGEDAPSFQADLLSERAGSFPLSGAERLLGHLARFSSSGGGLFTHPAVEGDEPGANGLTVPPLRTSIEAASAPVGHPFSRFEGHVGAALARDVSGELSPTRLEEYATCPRRYLLGRELRLAAPFRPESTEQMEARDRGTLVHEILAAYVTERIAGADESLDRLLAIAEERFAVASEEGRCGPPLMAAVERANLVRDLRRFYEEDTLSPIAAELAFGALASADDVPENRRETGPNQRASMRTGAVKVELADGRIVRFGGSVDRIDRTPDGSLVVSDYKTGRQGDLDRLRKDPVAGGTRLQLPIYALAAKAYAQWDGIVRARYWNLSWDRHRPSYGCTLDDRLLGRFTDVVSTIASGIESGSFPGHPGEEEYRDRRPTFANCRFCDFDRLCPVDRDRRWALAATSPEVEPVLRLAGDPDPGLEGIVDAEALDRRERQR